MRPTPDTTWAVNADGVSRREAAGAGAERSAVVLFPGLQHERTT